jgi:hypothetical protein
MGFFKKIGTAIKKNVSFKNLVKVATPLLGAIPIAGGFVQNTVQGLSDANQAKKDAKNAQQQADAQAQQNQVLAYAGQNIGAVANAGASMFAKGVTEGAYAGVNTGVTTGLGVVGADVADSTIKAWFTKHWKHILIGLSVVGAIYLIKKQMDNKNPRNRARTRARR